MLDQARQDRRVGGVAWRSRSDPQEAEHLLAVEEQLAMAVGDGAGDACLDDRDGQIAEGRHRLRSVARARATPVLVVGNVTDVVDRLDGPVTAQEGQDLGFAGPVERQAGDAEDDFVGLLALALDVAFHPKGLGGIGKAQTLDSLRQLDASRLDPAMALLRLSGVPGEKAPSPGRQGAGASSFGYP